MDNTVLYALLRQAYSVIDLTFMTETQVAAKIETLAPRSDQNILAAYVLNLAYDELDYATLAHEQDGIENG